MRTSVLIWFRNDLRLHDHRPLQAALQEGALVIPVYVFDPRLFLPTALGMPKTGYHRTRFLVESVCDLRANLRARGSDLIVRVGNPGKILKDLARETGARAVFYSQEETSEELAVARELENLLAGTGIAIASFWQSTLYLPEDIPYATDRIPAVFTTFRKGVEHKGRIRTPMATPEQFPSLPAIDPGPIPCLKALGISPPPVEVQSAWPFAGGETEGLRRLKHFIWESESILSYKTTRNGMLGADYASKLSPWLALGCLSPRRVWQEIKQFECRVAENESTYWLIFELLWRDYFRFWARHHGNQIFHARGIVPDGPPSPPIDRELFEAWIQGKTGMPFIDASMRELAQTGFLSNRGRQNVASYWINDLKQPWLWGAAYFESQLVDYDVCSNYGNWAYIAGVGADPRKDRYFNVMTQALRYDPEGEFVRHWIPSLSGVKGGAIHFIFDLEPRLLAAAGIRLGHNYPQPIVRPKAWGTLETETFSR